MRITPLVLLCLWTVGLHGQPALDTLRISQADAEGIFLRGNLLLLAAELDVSDAEARVIQARLWPNPVLAVGEINLWTNSGAEQLGVLIGRGNVHRYGIGNIEAAGHHDCGWAPGMYGTLVYRAAPAVLPGIPERKRN